MRSRLRFSPLSVMSQCLTHTEGEFSFIAEKCERIAAGLWLSRKAEVECSAAVSIRIMWKGNEEAASRMSHNDDSVYHYFIDIRRSVWPQMTGYIEHVHW